MNKGNFGMPKPNKTKFNCVDFPEDFSSWNSVSVDEIMERIHEDKEILPMLKENTEEVVYPIQRFYAHIFGKSGASFLLRLKNEHIIISSVNAILNLHRKYIDYSFSCECLWRIRYFQPSSDDDNDDDDVECSFLLQLYRFSYDEPSDSWTFLMGMHRVNGHFYVHFGLYDILRQHLADEELTERDLHPPIEPNFCKQEYRSFYMSSSLVEKETKELPPPFPVLEELCQGENTTPGTQISLENIARTSRSLVNKVEVEVEVDVEVK